MKNIKVVCKNINNKTLFKEINDVVYELLTTADVKWTSDAHRFSFIELIEDYLIDMKEEDGKIEQSKVVCDKRNNRSFSTLSKEYVFEIRYRQVGCLNITSIAYHIQNRK